MFLLVPAYPGCPGSKAVKRSVVVVVVSQEFGWEERLQDDPFYVEWDVKPCSVLSR